MESLKQSRIEGLKETKPVERVWQEVSGAGVDEYWKPKEGDSIEGRLSGSFQGHYGTVWIVECAGRSVGLPNNIMLQNLMIKVPVGSYCRITAGGLKPNDKKQSYKVFKVEVAAEGSPFA